MQTTLSPARIHVNVEASYGDGMALPVLTSALARMARAALRLEMREVSKRSGVSVATIVRVERETGEPTLGTMSLLQSCYEDAGIEFLDAYTIRYRPAGERGPDDQSS